MLILTGLVSPLNDATNFLFSHASPPLSLAYIYKPQPLIPRSTCNSLQHNCLSGGSSETTEVPLVLAVHSFFSVCFNFNFNHQSMARSFTNVKVIVALVADGFSNSLTRRGYAATAQSATRGVSSSSISGKIVAPKSGEDKVAAGEKVAWVPDPVTGYYKPENIKEIDVAELRATVLGKKYDH